DRRSRAVDVLGERRIAVLQERQQLEQQHVVGAAQLGESLRAHLLLVVSPKFFEQVVRLVLHRDLREHADRFRLPEACLEPGKVQRCFGGRRRNGGRRCNGGLRRNGGRQ